MEGPDHNQENILYSSLLRDFNAYPIICKKIFSYLEKGHLQYLFFTQGITDKKQQKRFMHFFHLGKCDAFHQIKKKDVGEFPSFPQDDEEIEFYKKIFPDQTLSEVIQSFSPSLTPLLYYQHYYFQMALKNKSNPPLYIKYLSKSAALLHLKAQEDLGKWIYFTFIQKDPNFFIWNLPPNDHHIELLNILIKHAKPNSKITIPIRKNIYSINPTYEPLTKKLLKSTNPMRAKRNCRCQKDFRLKKNKNDTIDEVELIEDLKLLTNDASIHEVFKKYFQLKNEIIIRSTEKIFQDRELTKAITQINLPENFKDHPYYQSFTKIISFLKGINDEGLFYEKNLIHHFFDETLYQSEVNIDLIFSFMIKSVFPLYIELYTLVDTFAKNIDYPNELKQLLLEDLYLDFTQSISSLIPLTHHPHFSYELKQIFFDDVNTIKQNLNRTMEVFNKSTSYNFSIRKLIKLHEIFYYFQRQLSFSMQFTPSLFTLSLLYFVDYKDQGFGNKHVLSTFRKLFHLKNHYFLQMNLAQNSFVFSAIYYYLREQLCKKSSSFNHLRPFALIENKNLDYQLFYLDKQKTENLHYFLQKLFVMNTNSEYASFILYENSLQHFSPYRSKFMLNPFKAILDNLSQHPISLNLIPFTFLFTAYPKKQHAQRFFYHFEDKSLNQQIFEYIHSFITMNTSSYHKSIKLLYKSMIHIYREMYENTKNFHCNELFESYRLLDNHFCFLLLNLAILEREPSYLYRIEKLLIHMDKNTIRNYLVSIENLKSLYPEFKNYSVHEKLVQLQINN